MHCITVLAVSVPLMAWVLCRSAGMTDGVTDSLFTAAATSFSGSVMWLRSRYIATLYLKERQARKQFFTDSLRRQCSGGAAAARRGAGPLLDSDQATEVNEEQTSPAPRPPRTVARLSPVPPAFMACCFFLLSIFSTTSAALHAIWYVRSLEAEQP
ncbi:hypothetical protein GH5_08149 [Leishmania sp. Ghana 2012 LV757]|uniref:hypothetical protein n=1 Tax=Leishmania sp. Ghana 2012 LV757 TaxID=2803181 RepID=UPI001B49F11B|nr:hypothetical protein GH5_08149 [Leishmania sp. Ghana 2012 LV757]